MNSFSYLLLAVISLSIPVLGGVLPDHHPEVRPCAPGTKMCHEDTVYRCSSLGTWVDNIQCIPPAHCFEDKHTQDAGCVDSHAELKRSDPTTTSAPHLSEDAYHGPPGRPSTSLTTTLSLTSDEHIKPGPHTGDLRCNGPVEEIYDDSTGWRVVQRCKECHTFSDGTINCAPLNPNVPTPTPCQISTYRCAGKWMEACVDGYHWQKLEKCLDCKETGHGLVNCAPDNLPSIPPHPVCKMGALRCRGNWFELCNADRQWQSVQRCAKCLESGTGGVSCEQQSTIQPADPTKPAASPTVIEVTPVAAAARTPAPELPDFEFPTGALKPDPDMEVAKDNPCFGGEVKCNGDRVNVCMASHQWEDFGPCPNCTQLYNTKVNCTWDFAEQADSFDSLLSQFIAAESLPTSVCEQGWQRCAESNTTVESCSPDGKWVYEESCDDKGRCVGISEGVAFCLDKETAEDEVRNFVI